MNDDLTLQALFERAAVKVGHTQLCASHPNGLGVCDCDREARLLALCARMGEAYGQQMFWDDANRAGPLHAQRTALRAAARVLEEYAP